MVKIRLMRIGRKNQPFYRVVVINASSPQQGRSIEVLGFYDPLTQPHTTKIKVERLKYWLERGAQMTQTVRHLTKSLIT